MITEYLIDKSDYKTLLDEISFDAVNGLKIGKRSTKYKGKENFILRLTAKDESVKGAEALSEISEKVKNVFNKNDVKYRVLTNESLSFFVKDLYPLICEYETKLRNLIHSAFFDVDQEVEKNIITKLQKVQKVDEYRKIGTWRLLELSDLGAIIDFLFSNDDLVGALNKYNSEKNKHLSKKELIEFIEQSDKHTIWEKFFEKDFSDSLIPTQLKEIKGYRNDVMHFHDISYERYIEAKNALTEGIKDLDKQIKKKMVIENSPENVLQLANHSSLWSALQNISSLSSSISNLITKPIMFDYEKIKSFSTMMADIYGNIVSPQLNELGDLLKNISSLYPSPILPTNPSMDVVKTIANHATELKDIDKMESSNNKDCNIIDSDTSSEDK